MKLHEYQSKQIFARNGIPIPKGRVAATAYEAKQIAEELGGRVVIKSHAGERRAKPAVSGWPRAHTKPKSLPRRSWGWKSRDYTSPQSSADEAASIEPRFIWASPMTGQRASRS
jgi:hypothetical protein